MEFNNDDVGVLPWGHERRGAHCTASIRKADLDIPVYLQGGPRFLMIFLLFALAHAGQYASITDILLLQTKDHTECFSSRMRLTGLYT